MNVKDLRNTPKVVLGWKMGSDSTQDIIALVPMTGPIERWMNEGFDFLIMPSTLNFLAPRFVEPDGKGGYTFSLFSKLDSEDKGFVNVCIQQVMTVQSIFDPDLVEQYLALVPDELKQQTIT
jgi:hypothetical protein